MRYDIMHVEDDPNERLFVGNNATKQGWSYLGLSCLRALEDALPASSAKVFVVDGNFPRSYGKLVEKLAPDAIRSIRQHYPSSRIVLYSSGNDIAQIAGASGVDFRSKRDFTARQFVLELQPMIVQA